MHSSYELIWFIGSNSHLFFHLCIDDDFEVPTPGHIHYVIRSASLYISVENIILLSVWKRRNGWLNFQPNWKVHTKYLENHSRKRSSTRYTTAWLVRWRVHGHSNCVSTYLEPMMMLFCVCFCSFACSFAHMNFDFIWAFHFVKTYASVAPAFDRPNEIIK